MEFSISIIVIIMLILGTGCSSMQENRPLPRKNVNEFTQRIDAAHCRYDNMSVKGGGYMTCL